MKKMKFSFFALLLLFFVGMGNLSYAQNNSMDSGLTSDAIPVLKQYDGDFVGKTEAIALLQNEYQEISSIVTDNPVEEASIEMKKAFITGAKSVLGNGGDVYDALLEGLLQSSYAVEKFANVSEDYPLVLLNLYGDLLSN